MYYDSSKREADELSFLEELTKATIQLARARLYPGKSGDLACHLDISSTDEESRTVNSNHATDERVLQSWCMENKEEKIESESRGG